MQESDSMHARGGKGRRELDRGGAEPRAIKSVLGSSVAVAKQNQSTATL